MSQYYSEEITEFLNEHINTLYKEFGRVKHISADEMYYECAEFKEFCMDAFRNASDAYNTKHEYSYE